MSLLLVSGLLILAPTDWPDPLRLASGELATRATWESTRKPELRALFQEHMYGRWPTISGDVSGEVVYENRAAFDGTATLREVAVTLVPGAAPVHWLIVTPNAASGPVPAFVGLNFTGNHTLTADGGVRISEGLAGAKRPTERNSAADTWPLKTIVGRGFAVVTAFYGDIVPDDAKKRGKLCEHLRPTPSPTDGTGPGAIAAWAWGLTRVAEYVANQVPAIDKQKLIVVGHSRLGKAAIVAGAFSDVFAAVIPSQAGCGGTAPNRRTNAAAESIERITAAFPHWFCPNYASFAADPAKLPFDQHALVALCAPRPVLFTNASEDQWADPAGQFQVLKAAGPVYALYGFDGAAASEYPPENQPVGGRLAFWVRPGRHAMTPAEWDQYTTWAKGVLLGSD